jgi:hypothetical protein
MTKTFTWTSAVQADSIDHSSLVIFVHVSNGQTFGQVLQSEEFDMSAATGVEHPTAPSAFALAQNYPNPFNPATTITFAVPLRSNVRIAVTDALGRSVATLVDADVDAGMHRALFDARSLPSGTYFVTMRAGAFVSTRTMTLMK